MKKNIFTWSIGGIISLFFLLFASSASAAGVTYYVNSASDGSHKNPTRAFNSSGYSANDSFKDIQSAYNVAANGDTIEISGGTSGASYAGMSQSFAKTLTVKGSRISGYDGTVTITYNPVSTYAVGMNADSSTLENVVVSGSNLGRALTIWKNNITVRNVTVKDPAPRSYALYISTPSGNTTNTFENVIVLGAVTPDTKDIGGLGVLFLTSGTSVANFNNSIIAESAGPAIEVTPGTTANFTNSIIAEDSKIDNAIFDFAKGGTVNTTYSLIQGHVEKPHDKFSYGSGGVWNSSPTDIINGFPGFVKTKENIGFVSLTTDDTQNIDYFTDIANYAFSKYGVHLTFYSNYTDTLSPADKLKLQKLVKDGHEVGVHTRHHNDLSLTNAIDVKYTGTSTNMALVVSGNGSSLSVTGSTDTHGPINLTTTTKDIGSLCDLINTWKNFSCARAVGKNNPINPNTPSDVLKDTSTSLNANATSSIPLDDSVGPNNRYFKEEIGDSITDLENAIHEDPSLASYKVKTMAFPYHEATPAVLDWIKANTQLIGVRTNDEFGLPIEKGWLGGINVYNAEIRPFASSVKGLGYASLTPAQQKDRIEKAARVVATFASNGYFSGLLSHDEKSDLTTTEWKWFLDELMKYAKPYNIHVDSFADLVTEIRTSGNWTNSGNGIWTRNFTGTDDFHLTSLSSLIGKGVAIPSRKFDYDYKPIGSSVDIGPYQFAGTISPAPTPTTTPNVVTTTPAPITIPVVVAPPPPQSGGGPILVGISYFPASTPSTSVYVSTSTVNDTSTTSTNATSTVDDPATSTTTTTDTSSTTVSIPNVKMVYAPGKVVRLQYSIRNPSRAQTVRITKLLVNKKGRTVVSLSARITIPSKGSFDRNVRIPLPRKVGDYTFIVRLTNPSGRVLREAKTQITISNTKPKPSLSTVPSFTYTLTSAKVKK